MNRPVMIMGLLFAMSLPASYCAAQGTTFKGEITDEKLNCIQSPMKATAGITDKTSCVLYWAHSAQPNSKMVLYDAETKTTYQLDDQSYVQAYAGEKVIVTGTLNPADKTIKVGEINVDQSAYRTGAGTHK